MRDVVGFVALGKLGNQKWGSKKCKTNDKQMQECGGESI